jgi:NADH-quinone oxidoreductase subunit J
MIGWAFFALAALAAVAGALLTVLARNPIRSAMALLLSILGVAGLFLALHAEFLATVELIVYAGAVVVLFVFVIMLIGPTPSLPRGSHAIVSRSVAGVAVFAGALSAAAVLIRSTNGRHQFQPAHSELGTVDAFGRELFTRGIVPFEIVTALLIVAVVGAIAVARVKRKSSLGAAERAGSEPR